MQPLSLKSNLFRLHTIVLLLILISVPAFGVDSESHSEKDTKSALKTEQRAKRNPAYNDYALFIAGMSNPQGSLATHENQ